MTATIEIESMRKEGRFICGSLLLTSENKKEVLDVECLMKDDHSGFEYVFLNGVNIMSHVREVDKKHVHQQPVSISAVEQAAKKLTINFYKSDSIYYKKCLFHYTQLN
ncbi:hypothetical protein [Alkalicoccus luteus]|uniref:Uncharacterized protein n=1 Tax=Alkalicoccus luteus TaxID=1237094 RepID=A0A969PUI2_9BACI|nr:hypothetical protein [Alkalicoccus luteus]NJP38641.1 hypothetical protein [Alkalicoccus luteus]